MAWKMAAIHTASSTRVQTSQLRNSSVGYEWFGRTSHQIFDPSGIVFVRTSVSTRYEKSSHDWNVRGMPLRGKLHPTYIPVMGGLFVPGGHAGSYKHYPRWIEDLVGCAPELVVPHAGVPHLRCLHPGG